MVRPLRYVPKYRHESDKPFARAGPPLGETLPLLKPLASTLEVLDLSGNDLRGTITSDIEAFTKLTKLVLGGMRLEGAFVGLCQQTARESELMCDRAHRAAADDAHLDRDP